MRRRTFLFLALILVPSAALLGYGLTRREPVVVLARSMARDYLAFWRARAHREVLLFASRESGVEPELLAAIMITESSGRVDVVSKTGALGLFQVSMTTAKWRAEQLGLPEPTREALLSDAKLNARLGADNMAWLLASNEGDELRALCIYNAGWGTMHKIVEQAGGWSAWQERGERSGKSEILAYAKKVLRYRDEFRQRGLFKLDEDEL